MADTPKRIKCLLREYAGAAHEEALRRALLPYNTPHLEMVVAFAITTGVLGRDTVPADVLEHLAGAMRFYEEGQATK